MTITVDSVFAATLGQVIQMTNWEKYFGTTENAALTLIGLTRKCRYADKPIEECEAACPIAESNSCLTHKGLKRWLQEEAS